jgi:hypothetical protein
VYSPLKDCGEAAEAADGKAITSAAKKA